MNQNKAYATWAIKGRNALGQLEAVLDVDSSRGWLGACVITAGRIGSFQDLESLCYAEADRRSLAADCRLETLRRAG